MNKEQPKYKFIAQQFFFDHPLASVHGWAMAKPDGFWIAKDGNDNSLIIRAAVDFTSSVREVKLSFQKLP